MITWGPALADRSGGRDIPLDGDKEYRGPATGPFFVRAVRRAGRGGLGVALAAGLLAPAANTAAEPRAVPPLAHPQVGDPAPTVDLRDIDGRRVSLRAWRGRVVALEWTNPVCPFTAKKYAQGAMQGLQKAARAAGVRWVVVDTSAPGSPGHMTPAQARARLRAMGAQADAVILDETGDLGRRYGAKATPTVFLVDRRGRLAYAGAVDADPYAETGDTALAAVRAALGDLERGRPVAVAETRPYGCPVEY